MERETVSVGHLRADPGTKVTGWLPVPGTPIEMPVAVVRGARPGPRLAVTAGVHGGEYPGIEAAIRTASQLDPADISGTVVIVHIVNVPAFQQRAIYVCPLDGKNPNRVFPGDPEGTASDRLAHTVFTEIIAGSDYYVDLHGGDLNESLVPFTIVASSSHPDTDARSLALAQAYGIPYVVRGRVGGATYAAAAQQGIPAILAEAGGGGILDEASVQRHMRGLLNVLHTTGILPGPPAPGEPVTVLTGFHWVTSSHTGLFYAEVAPGDRVSRGARVGEIRDYFGRRMTEVTSPEEGIVLFVVTSPATNPKDPLFAVGTPG
jgi:predicted deacylase